MSAEVKFREVILPPLWLIAFIYFMLFSTVLAIWAAFDDTVASISAVIAILLGVIAIFKTRREIVVTDELRIGRAHIPLQYLGEVVELDHKEFGYERTRGADPAAYFAIIFWLSRGVKVKVIDDRDSTPYWLISTKRGSELAHALRN
jgi:hypothetical protein